MMRLNNKSANQIRRISKASELGSSYRSAVLDRKQAARVKCDNHEGATRRKHSLSCCQAPCVRVPGRARLADCWDDVAHAPHRSMPHHQRPKTGSGKAADVSPPPQDGGSIRRRCISERGPSSPVSSAAHGAGRLPAQTWRTFPRPAGHQGLGAPLHTAALPADPQSLSSSAAPSVRTCVSTRRSCAICIPCTRCESTPSRTMSPCEHF